MKTFHLVASLALILTALARSSSASPHAEEVKGAQAAGSSGEKPTVYVSDLELDAVPAKAPPQAPPAAPGVSAPAPQAGAKKPEDDPRKQASHIVELMSASLVAALQQAGYSAVRLHAGDGRPEKGVGIRGLFAEVDKENHWRRAVIRTASDSGKMQVIVSVVNLAKPEQAFYEIASLPGNENKPGAVITLSPYVPLTKYELAKDADEAAFQTTASRIVNDLTALVNANPEAIAQ
jgi:hypothetical protein